ncbi:MAG: type II toxin-antitoxin system CcdA family antitoxin [Steroidobacteraceae bacterium]
MNSRGWAGGDHFLDDAHTVESAKALARVERGRDYLSAALERALTEELAAAKRKKWREENREAVQAYNEHVEKDGTSSDDVRRF